MRKTLVAILVVSAAATAAADDTNSQQNNSNSSSYGSLANYQINSNSEAFHQVGRARCAAPTVDAGIAGPKGLGNDSTAYMEVNFPLGGGTCKEAQDQELSLMKYDLHVAQVEQRKKDILFQTKMAQVCIALHATTLIQENNPLAKECSQFEPNHAAGNKISRSDRVAPHKTTAKN